MKTTVAEDDLNINLIYGQLGLTLDITARIYLY